MTKQDKPEILAETAAEQVRIVYPDGREKVAWACRTCRYVWADERAAVYCHATSYPCDCGERRSKHYTCCEACRCKLAAERHFAKPVVEWEGEYPVAVDDDDRFLFDEESLAEYLVEHVEDGGDVGDVWLVPCEPNTLRTFEVVDFWSDDLGKDGADHVNANDAAEIEQAVAEWAAANLPKLWYPKSEVRYDARQVAAALGVGITATE